MSGLAGDGMSSLPWMPRYGSEAHGEDEHRVKAGGNAGGGSRGERDPMWPGRPRSALTCPLAKNSGPESSQGLCRTRTGTAEMGLRSTP